MTPAAADKPIYLADVAFAVNGTPSTVKNWIARSQIKLFSEEPESGWREFSPWDIPILVLFRILVSYGMPPEQANELALTTVKLGLPDPIPIDLPIAMYKQIWSGRIMVVWKQGEKWRAGSFDAASGKSLDEAMEDAGVNQMIVINIVNVFDDAFKRLRDYRSIESGWY